ncbi:MAG: adenylate/guanylate cyclase domain-containing protein [Candidatus Tectimicrobiota bacterium]|nr:MAG: adenylate/guanylate cyclase domain-containing protein [Candidatus Tectomicrobia bacterium]
MARGWKAALAAGLIGLGAEGLVLLFVLFVGVAPLERLQVAANDYVFLAEEGPRLGIRADAGEIQLVLFDARSFSALGGLPAFEQDLQLYRVLLNAGARLVADTRMLADSGVDPASRIPWLLDQMLALDASGRLVRDVWLPGDWPPERLRRYRPVIAHNLLNMRPNADGFYESRLYPLVSAAVDGLHESMPLRLARAALGLPPLDSDEVAEQVKRAGIAAVWQRRMPAGRALPAAWRADGRLPLPYPLGERCIPWLPFLSKSPLIAPAAFWINYAIPPSTLPRISYVDVGKTRAHLASKIVVIGFDADVDPAADTYVVPTSATRVAAAETVAAALATVLRSRFMRPLPLWALWMAPVLLALIAALAGGLLRPVAAAFGIAALLAAYFAVAVALYRAGWLPDLVLAPAAALAGGLAAGGYRYWGEVRARLRITDLFGRYVPRAVVAQLVQEPEARALALGGVRQEVTVLFADIRGFTAFSERFSPEEVLNQLNALLRIMVDCTFAHEGTLDKFIGDAILVLFNAPLSQPDHTRRAARTAWAIQEGLRDHPSGRQVGIGIHRGEAVVGRVGTPQRMEYTAIGSTVNIASRLCSAARGGQIVVSEAAAAVLGEEFILAPQAPIHVKGIAEALQTYLLIGLRPRPGEAPEGLRQA